MARGTFWILLALIAPALTCAQSTDQRPRVIVTTDGEVDDRSSFVRFLFYSNDYDVEAIIATNSVWQQNGHGTDWIFDLINRYGDVHPNLVLHDGRFPMPDSLRGSVFVGNEDRFRMHGVGPENDSPGSDQIVRTLLDEDDRPVWLLAWGGTNTIAQALWRLKTSHSREDFEQAARKSRVYAIAVQDQTIWWIRTNVPEVVLVLNYQFTAINYEHEGHPLSADRMFDPAWITTNVKEGHGPLGAAYPQTYFSEGDSPSFFHLIDTGLRNLEDLSYGGWGGRFRQADSVYPAFWTDAEDDGDKLKPLWRWLPAIENDFAARVDWSVTDFGSANHPPIPAVEGALDREVTSGDTVSLNAAPSSDPDGDALRFSWWQYVDAGTYPAKIEILRKTDPEAVFVAPEVSEPQIIHFVLAVEDEGIPSLTRYRRVVITVRPDA